MTVRTVALSALTTSALAAAAVAPATAAAPENVLRGAPTMRLVDTSDVALLQFTVKNKLPRGENGKPQLRITVAGGKRTGAIRPAGRHGRDYKYNAGVKLDDPQVGAKYTVNFRFADAVSRKVKLRPAR